MDVDDLFIKSYLKDMNENERKKILLSQEDRHIAMQKKEKLTFIEKFLQKFVDLEVHVNHSDHYTKSTKTTEGIVPQKFHFYYVDSSKTWAPGVSIWFDHPAVVEIAIPNNPQEDGVVVIKVASHHPRAYLLEQRFTSYQAACEALGQFLGHCTTSIGKDPKKYMKEVEQRKQMQTDKPFSKEYIEHQDISLNKGTFHNEPAVLKENSNSSTLKKIGDFFHLNKNQNVDEEDE